MGVNVESPDATSVLRREMHGQRARQVLQVALWLLVGVESIWAVLGFVDGQVWLALVDGMTALGAATLLALPGMTTRMRAHCTFWLFFLFVWATLLLVDGLGVAHQGTNQIWFIAAALITLLVLFDEAQAVRVGYIAVCVLSFVVCEFGLIEVVPLGPLPADQQVIGSAFVMSAYFVAVIVLANCFVRDIAGAERGLAETSTEIEDLLGNILPRSISERLRREGRTFADGFAQCSILFADIVGFTVMSRALKPGDLVELLDRIFSEFDDLTAKAGLEKIKTIGDAYMVAAGVPEAREDHAQALADLALSMRTAMQRFPGLTLRIGMHSGPVVAGVIGRKRFIYDLWGDTVNVASRMESHGIPGEIQLSATMFKYLDDAFECRPRGEIAVKGHRPISTYLLHRRRQQ